MQGLPQVGDILDDTYRIESLLGQGGFGAVYLARQISMDRQVAIKVLVAHAMNVDEMIERFRREVMAVRNLQHPNTIRIYDFRGDREDGLLYYAMEYIKGDTLKDVLKGPLPTERVIHILRQILKSLSEAHSYGIVHRDLKPANIMLADLHGETDFVKVVDFGIAKIVGQAESDDDADPLTSAGVLVGTLRYMAPEQITGQGIGPQSDLYALALIGVEMLTGKSVFEGTGRWEVLHKQISDDPVDVPQEVLDSPLRNVFLKALEKRLEKRYKNADEMLKELTEVAAQLQTAGRPIHVSAPMAAVPQPQMQAPTQTQPTPEIGDESTKMVELPAQTQAAIAQSINLQPVMNPGLSQAPVPQATPQRFDTGPLEVIEVKKSKMPLIAGGGILLVLVLGVGYGLNMTSKTETNPDAPADVKTKPTEVAAKIEEPKNVEAPPQSRWARIMTPDVKAQIFDGDTLIGPTPLRIEFKGTENYIVKAEGYEDQPLKAENINADTIELQLVKSPAAVADVEPVEATKPVENTKPVEKPVETKTITRPVETKTTTKTVETKTTKPAEDDWVDIKAKPKPKPDVPIF